MTLQRLPRMLRCDSCEKKGFEPPSVFEIAMYPTPDGNKRVLDFLPSEAAEVTTLLLDKKARDLKRQMFDCFKTRPDLHRENSFGRERFRRPPRYNFAAPPNGGKLNYERVAPGVDCDEWQELVRKAWSELFPVKQSLIMRRFIRNQSLSITQRNFWQLVRWWSSQSSPCAWSAESKPVDAPHSETGE